MVVEVMVARMEEEDKEAEAAEAAVAVVVAVAAEVAKMTATSLYLIDNIIIPQVFQRFKITINRL